MELVPWWLVLGRFVVGGYLHTLELVPWWLVCLVGSWLVCPLLMPLGACVLLVGVLGGGYLHALELVPWLLVCLVGSWLAVTCMPWSLYLGGWCAWWWLPACLGACALVVGCWLVGSWLVCPLLMYLGACTLVVGAW